MNLKTCYQLAEADYEDVMRRFGTEERVGRFLKIFLRDGSFQELCDAIEGERYKEAFMAVHTMKGISLNLGFSRLAGATTALTENLRSCEANADTQKCFDEVKEAYLCTAESIRAYLGQ